MTTTRNPETTSPDRRTALAAGVLYVLTFVTSIPALALYGDVLDPTAFLGGTGGDGPVMGGAFLEILCGLTGIGTAVVLLRVLRRHDETAAIGFVASRTLEAAMIFVGALSLLSVMTLRQDATGADAGALDGVAHSLVAVHDWTFLFGPGFMPVLNALCLAPVLRRARLVPRAIPTLGLVAAPILLASSTATLFGLHDQVSSTAMLAALPIGAWELSLGLWMTFKGFTTPRPADEPVVGAVPASDRMAAALR